MAALARGLERKQRAIGAVSERDSRKPGGGGASPSRVNVERCDPALDRRPPQSRLHLYLSLER